MLNSDNFDLNFPIVKRIYNKTLGSQLISVKPGSFDDIAEIMRKQLLEERKKKIDKILKNINEKRGH